MSHLTTAKPKRLYRDGEKWVLEIERLTPWSDRILRPTTQRLVGEDVVLFQLDNSEDGRALAGDARRLMADGEASQPSYAVLDGRWVPTAFADQVAPVVTPRERPAIIQKAPALSAGSLEVHLLREDLRELRAAYDRLTRRVATLEKNPRAAAGAQGAPEPEAPAPAAPAPPAPADTGMVMFGDWMTSTLQIPSVDVLAAQIIAMTGETEAMTTAKKPLEVGLQDQYVSWIVDNTDTVLGAMISNLEGVVTKGARLMLLPEHEIAEQIKARAPTEEVTSAMGEMFNVMTATFNAIPDNKHVRVRQLELLGEAEEWVKTSTLRTDLADSTGSQVAFIVKPE